MLVAPISWKETKFSRTFAKLTTQRWLDSTKYGKNNKKSLRFFRSNKKTTWNC